MAAITRLVDAMLARIAAPEEAGACVPNVGDSCPTTYEYKCVEHLKYKRAVYRNVSCSGPCTASSYGPWISYTHC